MGRQKMKAKIKTQKNVKTAVVENWVKKRIQNHITKTGYVIDIQKWDSQYSFKNNEKYIVVVGVNIEGNNVKLELEIFDEIAILKMIMKFLKKNYGSKNSKISLDKNSRYFLNILIDNIQNDEYIDFEIIEDF
jgi:beta-xylosidase